MRHITRGPLYAPGLGMVLNACPPNVRAALRQMSDIEIVNLLADVAKAVYDDLSVGERAEMGRIFYELQTISGMGVNSALQLVQRLGFWLQE